MQLKHILVLLTFFIPLEIVNCEPILNLVCLPEQSFKIQVDKQDFAYVELYAKGFMGDPKCSIVSSEASETQFEFEINVDVESELPCNILYHEDSNTYEFKFYVAGQSVILTARDSIYDASCNFEKTMHRVTTTNTHKKKSDGPQTRSDEAPEGIQFRRLTAAEDARTASMRIFSLADQEFTNSADVGDEIQLVLVLDQEQSGFQSMEFAAECSMYSSENKEIDTMYTLTTDLGCPTDTNSLFDESFDEVSDSVSLLLEATERAISTPIFKAPYYPKTGQLFFECVVEFCDGNEPSNHPCNMPPDCSKAKNTRRQRSFDESQERFDDDRSFKSKNKTNQKIIGGSFTVKAGAKHSENSDLRNIYEKRFDFTAKCDKMRTITGIMITCLILISSTILLTAIILCNHSLRKKILFNES